MLLLVQEGLGCMHAAGPSRASAACVLAALHCLVLLLLQLRCQVGAALVPPGWIPGLHCGHMGAWVDDCSIMSCVSIQQCKRMAVSFVKY